MSIGFTAQDWARITDVHERWWRHELDRPLISVTLGGREPDRPASPTPLKAVAAGYGPEVTPEQIVDAWDYGMSKVVFLGDAFPQIRPNFGPSCNAAFLGARADIGTDTVWFHPPAEIELADLDFRYDSDNAWLKRVQAVCRAAAEFWRGSVCMGICDVTPNLDTLSVFRPGERLLLDLCDHPDEVDRLVVQLADLFWRHFHAIQDAMRPYNPGYTCWIPLYSREPYYALQCDFCYMIGPAMFDRFVRPDLVDATHRIPRTIFHLDGPGQLPHLDSLLSIEGLGGVQWIAGAGRGPERAWLDVYRRIHAAGKLIVIHGGFDDLDAIAQALGTGKGIALLTGSKAGTRAEIERRLPDWGLSG